MDARLGWLLLGCVIGFVFGYLTRYLREIKERVEEVDEHIKKVTDDRGFSRIPIIRDVILIAVVAATFWASIVSQANSNKVQQTTNCTREFLGKTIVALNERTTYTKAVSDNNVDLQKAFNVLVTSSLHDPPPSKAESRRIVETYAAALHLFLATAKKNSKKVDQNPFPTDREFQDCINA